MANTQNIAAWISALLSGDFEQTRLRLAGSDGYCCLGVACEAALKAGVPVEKREYTGSDAEPHTVYDGASAVLPDKVMEWLGIDECNPVLSGCRAGWWNDTAGLGFQGIAALIANKYGIPFVAED